MALYCIGDIQGCDQALGRLLDEIGFSPSRDTVFLLGTVANTHGDERWVSAAGAMAASVIWFFGLAVGARYLSRWLSTPRAWRILDAVIAVVMIGIGISLVLPH